MVLDASVALSWHFEDENSAFSEEVLDRLANDTAVVPSIWPLEIANVLTLAERRGRITHLQVGRALELSLGLPLTVHPFSLEETLTTVVDLAREHGLTAYDAAYLGLALQLGLPIATEDTDLLAAARRAGLPELA